jgi:hypothetical protein
MPFSRFERRHFSRLRVRPDPEGEFAVLQKPFALREIGLGGFAVESPFWFPLGQEQNFEFTLADGRQVALRATVVHCVSTTPPGKPARHVAGFAFVKRDSDEAIISELVKSVLVPMQSRVRRASR